MIIGVLSVDLAIPEAQSLKNKRRVILSLKERLRQRYNVSVAEIDFQDMHQRCKLGIATVSNETRAVHSQLDRLVDTIRQTRGVMLVDYQRTML